MSDRKLLRPGVLAGFYPEQEDERLGTLDRLMAQGMGWLNQLLARRPLGRYGFLMRVRRAERRLAELSDSELAHHAVEVSRDLRLRGLTPSHVVRAFALVSEMSSRRLGMRHFNVQLLGGLVMLNGQIAEMATGEGKTLTATLTAAVMALSGVPVHVITVNDFLAERDARWMGTLYRALGLSVGVVIEGMSPDERRAAYACDITYCTNKQVVFDYLKDRLAMNHETRPLHLALDGLYADQPRASQVVMRGLCFAIVDEADSVLIDEARTPLIIAKQGDASGMEETYARAISVARGLRQPRDFTLRERDWQVELTELGRAALRRATRRFGGVWATDSHREELAKQALSALHLYRRDTHYLVTEGTVQIVDEYTGRVMADRSWERGLHQMIEVKEGLEITTRQETLIRLSYQRFFRRYVRLSGMTGTASEVAGELSSVYRLKTRRVPTNRRSRRRDFGQYFYATEDRKWQAVLREIAREHRRGRPILVGTQSVAASEHLAALLDAAGLSHRVLNARHNDAEAEIIADAGTAGRITVATNMAGRGTDIKPDAAALAAGGLHVIATGRHDARRIDRQLYGRAARQGDPGSHITLMSLEDDLIRLHFGTRLTPLSKLADLRWSRGRVPAVLARPLMALAQHAGERQHLAARKSLLKADDGLEDLLAFSGRTE